MIHDPQEQDVTCDGKDCNEELAFAPASDSSIERGLVRMGWIVLDGKHYCPECGQKL